MSTSYQPTANLPRRDFLRILNAALLSGSYRFARQAALYWLSAYPGDLVVSLGLAKAHLAEGRAESALEILEKIYKTDPEYEDVLEVLSGLAESSYRDEARANLVALGKTVDSQEDLPDWCFLLRQAKLELDQQNIEQAENLVYQVLGKNPDSILASIFHVKVNQAHEENTSTLQIASMYHRHWPDCLQFKLCMADVCLTSGIENGFVDMLHECAASDPAAQVPHRLWGRNFRYRPLWPERLEVAFDIPIPADVAARLGMNQLSTGDFPASEPLEAQPEAEPASIVEEEEGNSEIISEITEPPVIAEKLFPGEDKENQKSEDDTLRSAEQAFERIAKILKQPEISRMDGRFPVYVIFSTHEGITTQYGEQTFSVIDGELKKFAEVIRQRPGMGVLLHYADDAACTEKLGLKPVEGKDPWKLKLALKDLDQALAHKGEMIGALLIVGGDEIVPFHRLPNPTDDMDKEVLSDNPYSTLDSNYFIPEWPTGRLPGESGHDAGALLKQIRQMIGFSGKQTKNLKKKKGVQQSLLLRLLQLLTARREVKKKIAGFGYAAAAWKISSSTVYRTVADPNSLLMSPPEHTGTIQPDRVNASTLGYYNLHGVVDGSDWYGQKIGVVGSGAGSGPDYPVALSPRNLVQNGEAPKVVFSEACYGGHILNKQESQSICLRFLGIGTQAVIASTAVAYGAVATPLVGADFLASLFWKRLSEGMAVGDALMQARIDFAQELNQRQGFLDGEDQKTLISFVLYGDPLAIIEPFQKESKTIRRSKTQIVVKTVSDRADENGQEPVATDLVKEAKKIASQYLPGLSEGEVLVSQQHLEYEMKTRGNQSIRKRVSESTGQVVVTIHKQYRAGRYNHQHFARVTFNKQGKMVKLALSR